MLGVTAKSDTGADVCRMSQLNKVNSVAKAQKVRTKVAQDGAGEAKEESRLCRDLKDHGKEFLFILKTMFLIYIFEQYLNQFIKMTSCVKNGLEGTRVDKRTLVRT